MVVIVGEKSWLQLSDYLLEESLLKASISSSDTAKKQSDVT